ncbi:hypothetical protein AGLY_000444 [Aphis glycines]|uniref:Uncharacterized protein n=1 Tax=Aphis glycines TaxID=307491 RepID=A0A6G0U705_APHGL|nr:hypothetical protein AGLY_000444 [Aphis glycines]
MFNFYLSTLFYKKKILRYSTFSKLNLVRIFFFLREETQIIFSLIFQIANYKYLNNFYQVQNCWHVYLFDKMAYDHHQFEQMQTLDGNKFEYVHLNNQSCLRLFQILSKIDIDQLFLKNSYRILDSLNLVFSIFEAKCLFLKVSRRWFNDSAMYIIIAQAITIYRSAIGFRVATTLVILYTPFGVMALNSSNSTVPFL